MNLASPAPIVEEAVAEKSAYADAAIADRSQQSEQIHVDAPPVVDPALPYDDPMRYAPAIVRTAALVKANKISAQMLRGTTGSDFESEAAICRGAAEKNFLKKWLPLVFDERDFATYGELKKFCLMKEGCIFVFASESDPNPLWALPLDDIVATIEDRDNPDTSSITISPEPITNKQRKNYVTVLLKFRSSKKEKGYQFTFDTEKDPTRAQRFVDALSKSQVRPSTSQISASAVHAKNVAERAMKGQPMI